VLADLDQKVIGIIVGAGHIVTIGTVEGNLSVEEHSEAAECRKPVDPVQTVITVEARLVVRGQELVENACQRADLHQFLHRVCPTLATDPCNSSGKELRPCRKQMYGYEIAL
jgi:hypothetical protein